MTGFEIFLLCLLAAAVLTAAGAIRSARSERAAKNALYVTCGLPKAAQTISLPRYETPEYKLERAENSLRFVREEKARLEAENRALAVQKCQLMTENSGLRGSYAALEEDYLRQFRAGHGVVNELVALFTENERLRTRLTEETVGRQQAELLLRHLRSPGNPDMVH